MISVEAVDQFMQVALKDVSGALRASLGLFSNTSEETENSAQYRKVLGGLSLKVLTNIQSLINKQDGKGNILDTGEKKALEDKFNILVEVNDRLLDRCNNLISSIENPDVNKHVPVVVVEYSIDKDKPIQDGTKMTPSQTIKLISSVQIERPQLKFAKQPDNSKVPFRPILTKKPNAMIPLVVYEYNDEENYIHPYEYELENFVTPKKQMELVQNFEMPLNLDKTPYQYIDTIEQLSTFISTIKTVSEIAVDVEHHNMRTYMGLTCLLQISSRTTDYVIDTLALHGRLEGLNEIFTNPNILKVFHGANSDVMWLQRDLGVYIINMFDSGQACTILNMPRKSLSYLLEKYCHLKANKEYQRLTDWRIRPLFEELIEYARTDTHYLLYIYDCLKNELINEGKLEQVYTESKKLCCLIYHKPTLSQNDSMDLYKKSNEQFNPRQMYALKRLWELRDNIAREEDESPTFILPNRLLLTIAQVLPRETSGVLACCSQDWKLPLLRKYVYDFQKICLEAYNESINNANKRVVVKRNVLERLLCRHDLTNVDETIEIKPDVNEVLATVNMNSTNFLFKNSSLIKIPDNLKVIETFIKYHPLEKYTTKDSLIIEEKEDELAVECEEVEVIEVQKKQYIDNVDIEEKVEEAVRPPKVRKVADVTHFDYEASVKKLMGVSRTDNKTKSFNPFVTKKFKKNSNGKK